jgi:phenylacetate-CoA ligase
MDAWRRFRDDALHLAAASAADELARTRWSADQIRQSQRDGLRTLLTHAAEHSPFHRERLAAADLDGADPSDMSALPVMTKAQMMGALDDVFTDRVLRREAIESALTATGSEPVPIHGEYVALTTGGCSGQRGVFVLDRAAVAMFLGSVSRQPDPFIPIPDTSGGPPLLAMVAAPSAVHATGLLSALTSTGAGPVRTALVPASRPTAEIVDRLNALQPAILTGYASILSRLAAEQTAGRLRISPVAVSSTSETLLPELRTMIRKAFGVPVVDGYGSTEGLFGKTCADDDVFVFNTDRCIVEIVDDDNRPVPIGEPSAKVLITNLANLAQPLIRYELTDAFVRLPDADEHGHVRARVYGRSDDILDVGGVDVHPVAIRSVMVTSPTVIDYQVRQTRNGLAVHVITDDGHPIVGLAERLRSALVTCGVGQPDVEVVLVDQLDRHPATGKLRRFVPFGAASGTP